MWPTVVELLCCGCGVASRQSRPRLWSLRSLTLCSRSRAAVCCRRSSNQVIQNNYLKQGIQLDLDLGHGRVLGPSEGSDENYLLPQMLEY